MLEISITHQDMLFKLTTRIRDKYLKRIIFVTKILHNSVFLSLIIIPIIINFVQAEETAQSIGFFVTNESCCGEDSDPHAVHGIEVPGGALFWLVNFQTWVIQMMVL